MRMLALLLVVAMTQTPTLAWTQACQAPSNPVRTPLHFSVGIAGGNLCPVPLETRRTIPAGTFPEARCFGGRGEERSLVPLGEARLGRF
jgi:hypothetical protein